MATAIIGLIGVLVGAAINGVAQWTMVRRSDRLRARTSARLIRYELLQYQQLLDYSIKSKYWETGYWTSPVRWREHSAELAAACSGTEWAVIERAYLGLEIVDSWHRTQPGSSEPPPVEQDPQRSGMPTILGNINSAMHSLARLADTEVER